jgi:hypothetical protein
MSAKNIVVNGMSWFKLAKWNINILKSLNIFD